MTTVDLGIIVGYLGLVLLVGIAIRRRREFGETNVDFFLGGRKLPWWAVGTSMVATTFSVDTPLVVVGLTLSVGVAGQWLWWSFALSHVLVAVLLARLWRRSGVVTDTEFVELRYPDRAAPFLRAFKAFYMAVVVNCLVMGFVFMAMVKILHALVPGVPTWASVTGLMVMVVLYSLRSGFLAVVATDLIQFPLAFAGAVVLCVASVNMAGGLDTVTEFAVAERGDGMLALFPAGGEELPWNAVCIFLVVQWWAHKNADGGGMLIQRMLAAKDEQNAELGGIWFCIAHYVLRPWPWILAGLAAMIIVPDVVASDPEQAYPALVRHLPEGLRGLLVASFLAAFMSTMDTHLNWGASYLTPDLAGRFSDIPEIHHPVVSRISVVVLAGLAVIVNSALSTIVGAWEIIIAFGAGMGAIVLLRWLWWRVSAWAELSAMIASTALSVAAYQMFPHWDHPTRLLAVALGSAAVWLPVTLLARPSPRDLGLFYRTVRPPGPGWKTVADACDEPAPASLAEDLAWWLFGSAGIFALMFGVGDVLLGAPLRGILLLVVGAVFVTLLVRHTLQRPALR